MGPQKSTENRRETHALSSQLSRLETCRTAWGAPSSSSARDSKRRGCGKSRIRRRQHGKRREDPNSNRGAQLAWDAIACSRGPHTCMMRDNTFEVVALVRARRLRTHASSRKRARSGHSFGRRGKQVCADGWRCRYACSQRAHGLATRLVPRGPFKVANSRDNFGVKSCADHACSNIQQLISTCHAVVKCLLCNLDAGDDAVGLHMKMK